MDPRGLEPRHELAAALNVLSHPDPDRQEAALEEIEALARGGSSPVEVTRILEAAQADLPTSRMWGSGGRRLVRAIWGRATDEHVSRLRACLPALAADAHAAVLTALARLHTPTSTAAWVELLREFGWPEETYPAMILPYELDLRFAELVLPAFVDGSIGGLPAGVRDGMLLAHATAGALPAELANAALPDSVRRCEAALDRCEPFQEVGAGSGWRWAEEYGSHRDDAGLALDLVGWLGSFGEARGDTVAILRRAELVHDPRLKLFAILSLVRLGEEPGAEHLRAVAAEAETRSTLFEQLSALNALRLFPAEWAAQEELAESYMVRWLTFPTELGSTPDHIELMGTIERDAGHGADFVYYVFRFKMDPPHPSAEDGWMGGISGPFLAQDFPTGSAWGDTFSTFESWEEYEPEDHVASVEDLRERLRASGR